MDYFFGISAFYIGISAENTGPGYVCCRINVKHDKMCRGNDFIPFIGIWLRGRRLAIIGCLGQLPGADQLTRIGFLCLGYETGKKERCN
jgi:hypothetical protein